MSLIKFQLLIILGISGLNTLCQTIQFLQINNDLDRPVDIAFEPITNYSYIVEQNGEIELIDSLGNKISPVFLDIKTQVLGPDNTSFPGSQNEQGLLGMAFHPDFDLILNPYFYVMYTQTPDGSIKESVVSRFTVTTTPGQSYLSTNVNSEFIIMKYQQPYNNHNGGELEFGIDGYLYIGTGDGGSSNDPQNRAQNLFSLHGKMLRIDVDSDDFLSDSLKNYAIPSSNPFVGSSNGIPEILMYGLRNPWRFSFDKANNNLWIGDVGQNAYEEINKIVYPFNYTEYDLPDLGWRCYEAYVTNNSVSQTNCPNFIDTHSPFFAYPQNNITGGFSVTGGYVYRGCEYPQLYGYYIFADYVSGNIWLTNTADHTTNMSTLNLASISSFGEDFHNELYYVTLDGTFGHIAETTSLFNSVVTLEGDLQSGDYAAYDAINCNSSIVNGNSVTLKAGNYIELSEGFNTDNLSNTFILIDPFACP